MSEIRVVKLVTGEELLTSVDDTSDLGYWTLTNPYVIVMGPEGAGMMPWIPYAETEKAIIDNEHILVMLEPKEMVKVSYSKMVGKIILNESKIQLAN